MKKYLFFNLFAIFCTSFFAQVDGTIDNSFLSSNSGVKGSQGPIYDIIEQTDGKVLIVGEFDSYNQIDRNSVVRFNADGSMDSGFNQTFFKVGGISGTPPLIKAIALQPNGKIIVGGNYRVDTGLPNNDLLAEDIIRLNSDGTRDPTFIAAVNATPCGDIEDIIVQPDGKIIIVGNITFCVGSTINNNENILRLNTDGTIDNSFQVQANGFNVKKVLLQNDSKIIIGGVFSNINGVSREGLARLNPDGSLDTTFDIGTGFNDAVNSIALQSNGKLIVVGDFTTYNGATQNKIVRLNTDGTVDTSFSSGNGPGRYSPSSNSTFIRDIETVSLQSDGKIIIGGNFNRYNGGIISKVARLNADGSLDTNFNNVDDEGFSTGAVFSSLVKSDGKIVVGGAFKYLKQRRLSRIAQLNSNGSIDVNFNPTIGPSAGLATTTSTIVNKIMPHPTQGFYVAGQFIEYDDNFSRNIARLTSDGSYDPSFTTGTDIFNGFDDEVLDFVVQADGKVVVVGEFENYNQVATGGIIRLNPNGSIDNTFIVGSGVDTSNNRRIETIVLQPDGKFLISGFFIEFNGSPLEYFGRLNSNGSIDTTFNTGSGVNNADAIFLLDNGKILLSGVSNYNGTSILGKLARINSDGSLDNTFNASGILGGEVSTFKQLSNGQYLIGGIFGSIANPQPSLLRLNSDGSIDNSFNVDDIMLTANSNGVINDIELQADGKIIIGGNFTTIKSRTIRGLARLNGDGTLDTTFNPEVINNNIESYSGINEFSKVTDLHLEDSGRLLVAGDFGVYNNEFKTPLIAVYADIPAILSTNLLKNIAKDLRLYPNPAINTFTMQSIRNIESVFVFDITGKKVKAIRGINSKEKQINIQDLTNGVYLVQMQSENTTITKKLVIQ